jgi:ABC-type nitrate/sulfonate/bicarbonate transport system ATPase subunit
MDEPFGALDATTRGSMQSLLVSLHKAHPCVIVFVTHDVTEALLVGDRVMVMSTQPAKLIDDFRIGTPQPRSAEWLALAEVRGWQDRVMGHLRATAGRGSVRVSV